MIIVKSKENHHLLSFVHQVSTNLIIYILCFKFISNFKCSHLHIEDLFVLMIRIPQKN